MSDSDIKERQLEIVETSHSSPDSEHYYGYSTSYRSSRLFPYYSQNSRKAIKWMSICTVVIGLTLIICLVSAFAFPWVGEFTVIVGVSVSILHISAGSVGTYSTRNKSNTKVQTTMVLNIICTLASILIIGFTTAEVNKIRKGARDCLDEITGCKKGSVPGWLTLHLIMVVCSVLLLIFHACISILIFKAIRTKSSSLTSSGTKLAPESLNEDMVTSSIGHCKIDNQRLNVGPQIGKGYFGSVFKGTYTLNSGGLTAVAIKTLKGESVSSSQVEQFLEEGMLMVNLKHVNILSLIGVAYETGSFPMVVVPFMANGDLKTFIQRDDMDIVLGDVLHFAYQISNGMSYLANERFVHRDLAARNCLLDYEFIIKIGDFGMSRDVYSRDYYVMDDLDKPLPLKWMALESMTEGRYSSLSDVWSFGVLVWELLTRGSTPYPIVPNHELKNYLLTNQRLDRPECCPPIVYEMMTKCWMKDQEERPQFARISDFLNDLLKSSQKPDNIYSYARATTRQIPDNYVLDAFI